MKIILVSFFILFTFSQNQESNHSIQNIQYTADNTEIPEINKDDQIIEKEIEQAKKVMVNNKHSQHYGFILTNQEDQNFIFAVDVDEEMQAIIIVYWEQDDNYIVSKALEGEDVRIMVYQDQKVLIGTWGFYHAAGITFHAKKQHEYLMKIVNMGRNKMLVMDVENFVYKGSSQHIAGKEHIQPHQQKMKSIKSRLQAFMTVTQSNHIINELIAQNVVLHMKRYMGYQVMECIVIFGFALGQAYFIRKLLTKGYHSLV